MLPALMVLGTVVTLVVLVILAVIVIGIIMYLVGIYNNLVTLKNDLDRSFANIDVLLKQRHDELPKLIETCKGYMQYEQKTLQAVTEARAAYTRATTPADKDPGRQHDYRRAAHALCRGGEVSRLESQRQLHAAPGPHHGTGGEDRRPAQPATTRM